MFSKVKQVETAETVNVIDFLLVDNSNLENTEILNSKIRHLENKFGLKPTDDLGIIRITN